MDKKKPELLLPAGDIERLKIAFLYGADAVYLGGPALGLRANAINFTMEEIKEACLFAHEMNKKIYVTVNIAFHNKELGLITDYLKELESIKVDAIIISDPAVLEVAKKNTNLKLFISTQQSTLNYEAIDFWSKKGISRIIMGREVTKEELIEIKNRNNIEIECFIHGAMCASYSGRCVLSNFLTNRDSNRGGCSQICRWDFDLLDKDKNLFEAERKFTFCTKDLSMLKYIKDMMDIGIDSFKVEGRMRSIYYIATIASIYRKVIDEYWNNKENYEYNEKYEIELRRCANRDAVCQFFNGVNDETCQYYNGRDEVSNQDFLGLVLDYNNGYALIEERNYFKIGDEVTIFGPNHEPYDFKMDKIIDDNNNDLEFVNVPLKVVKIKCDKEVYKNDMMRVNIS